MAVVESVKSVSDVFAPVSGEVVDVNNELTDAPEILNKEPYGKGWIAKVKIENIGELDNLLTAEKYDTFLKETKH